MAEFKLQELPLLECMISGEAEISREYINDCAHIDDPVFALHDDLTGDLDETMVADQLVI